MHLVPFLIAILSNFIIIHSTPFTTLPRKDISLASEPLPIHHLTSRGSSSPRFIVTRSDNFVYHTERGPTDYGQDELISLFQSVIRDCFPNHMQAPVPQLYTTDGEGDSLGLSFYLTMQESNLLYIDLVQLMTQLITIVSPSDSRPFYGIVYDMAQKQPIGRFQIGETVDSSESDNMVKREAPPESHAAQIIVQRSKNFVYHTIRSSESYKAASIRSLLSFILEEAKAQPRGTLVSQLYTKDWRELTFFLDMAGNYYLETVDLAQLAALLIPLVGEGTSDLFYGNVYTLGMKLVGRYQIAPFGVIP